MGARRTAEDSKPRSHTVTGIQRHFWLPSHDRIAAPWLLEGPIDGRKGPRPLRPGDIVAEPRDIDAHHLRVATGFDRPTHCLIHHVRADEPIERLPSEYPAP